MTNEQKIEAPDRTLDELIEVAREHEMTPEEYEAQRQSFARAMSTPCEHGVLDFEQCPNCRTQAAVGATVRACAKVASTKSDGWHSDYKTGHSTHRGSAHREGMSDGASDVEAAILALEPEAQQALDKLLAEKEREAKRMGLEFAIEWFEDHHVRLKENQTKEIRAALEAE